MEEMGSFEGNGYGEFECLLNAGWANDFTQLTSCGHLEVQIQAFFRWRLNPRPFRSRRLLVYGTIQICRMLSYLLDTD